MTRAHVQILWAATRPVTTVTPPGVAALQVEQGFSPQESSKLMSRNYVRVLTKDVTDLAPE